MTADEIDSRSVSIGRVQTFPGLRRLNATPANIGQTAFVLLLITGPLMAWLKFGGVGGFSFWFWIKMVLVATFLGVIIYANIIHAKMEKGDLAAAKWERILDVAGIVAYVAIIFCAVFAFN